MNSVYLLELAEHVKNQHELVVMCFGKCYHGDCPCQQHIDRLTKEAMRPLIEQKDFFDTFDNPTDRWNVTKENTNDGEH